MNHRIVWLSLAAIACEPVGPGSSFVPTTSDSGTTPLDTGSPVTMATQVGSEGLWGCPIEILRQVDALDEVSGIGVAGDVALQLAGDWTLSIGNPAVPGLLSTLDTAYGVASSPVCADQLVVEASGTMARDGVTLGVTAILGFDGTRSVVFANLTDDPATVGAAWGLTPPVDALGTRLVLSPDPSGKLLGSVAFSPCEADVFECPEDIGVWGVTGVR